MRDIQFNRRSWLAAIVLFLSMAWRGSAEPISYTFTAIAANISSIENSGPALNNLGTVAFTTSADPRSEGGVFAGNGGPLTTIFSANGFSSSSPSINDAGMVAFYNFLQGGVFVGSGGPLTTIDTSVPFIIYAGPSINNEGTVATYHVFEGSQAAIFTGNGRPLTTIADSQGQFRDLFNPPTMNDAGTVAFAADLRSGGDGIFTGNGGPLTRIVDTSGPFSIVVGPSINNAGAVAFYASGGGGGIFVADGTTTRTIADTAGPFSGFETDVSMNDLRTVAFLGRLRTGGEGLFTGPDPAADKVIAVGDALFGSGVTRILFGPEGLNDAGQVAFLAGLSDGRFVIARADPVVVPEPSALLLCFVGTAGLILVKRRMRHQHPGAIGTNATLPSQPISSDESEPR
jgi:hypothetical protein